MQRFTMIARDSTGLHSIADVEDDKGSWVQFEEASEEIDILRVALEDIDINLSKMKSLVHRMATVIGDAWEDLRNYPEITEMLDEAEAILKEET